MLYVIESNEHQIQPDPGPVCDTVNPSYTTLDHPTYNSLNPAYNTIDPVYDILDHDAQSSPPHYNNTSTNATALYSTIDDDNAVDDDSAADDVLTETKGNKQCA